MGHPVQGLVSVCTLIIFSQWDTAKLWCLSHCRHNACSYLLPVQCDSSVGPRDGGSREHDEGEALELAEYDPGDDDDGLAVRGLYFVVPSLEETAARAATGGPGLCRHHTFLFQALKQNT